jgi:hypothetical protein
MHGQKNILTTFSNRNHVAVFVIQSVTSVASAHLVKYYVTVIIYLGYDLLASGLIGPMKSISHLSRSCRGTYVCKGILSLMDGFPTL